MANDTAASPDISITRARRLSDPGPSYPPARTIPRRAASTPVPETAVPAPPTNIGNEALAVRQAVARRALDVVSRIGLSSRFTLCLRAFLSLGQIAAFIVVLAITPPVPSDCTDLKTYLAVTIVRLAITWPLGTFVSTFVPTRAPANEDAEHRASREARRLIGDETTDARLRSLNDLLTVFSLACVQSRRWSSHTHSWFVYGNWGWATSQSCRSESAPLYWSTMVALLFGWIYALEIAVIVLAVVLFLPIVILILRLFGVGGDKKHEIGPLSQAEIDRIPLVLYIPAESDATAEPTDATVESTLAPIAAPTPITKPETTLQKPRKRRRLIRLFRSPRNRQSPRSSGEKPTNDADGPYVDVPYPLRPLPENLSTCSICLTDLEPPPRRDADATVTRLSEADCEPLRLLPCGHCLHRDCVDPWLSGTSGRCPICQAPVTINDGKRKRRRSEAPPRAQDLEAGPDAIPQVPMTA